MPDKISPLLIFVESFKKLTIRSKRNLLLFVLLVGLSCLDELAPPDPFIWLSSGLPLMMLAAPAEVLVFHNLLSGTEGEPRLVPGGMFRKCVLFFLWSCLSAVVTGSTYWIASFTFIAVAFGYLLSLVIASDVAIQIANVLAIGLGTGGLIAGIWFLITRALALPGIVAGAAQPFRDAGVMIKGTFWRFCFSFVLLVLPLVAAMILLDRFGQGSDASADAALWFQGCTAVLDAAADMLCFSGLCVWYEKLRLRMAGPDSGQAFEFASEPPAAPYEGAYSGLPGGGE